MLTTLFREEKGFLFRTGKKRGDVSMDSSSCAEVEEKPHKIFLLN
jgi:hypothetical protein